MTDLENLLSKITWEANAIWDPIDTPDNDPLFLIRCKDVATDIEAVVKTRTQYGQRKHCALPVIDFLNTLCLHSEAQVKCLLRWAKMDESAPQSLGFAAGWGRLASTLGLIKSQAVINLRLSHFEFLQPEVNQLLLSRFRAGRRSSQSQLNIELNKFIEDWSPVDQKQLKYAETEMELHF